MSSIPSNGPTGPMGVKGSTGPIGVTGLKGATGSTGPMGLRGSTGPNGSAGLKGETGAAGATGATGPMGLKGSTGPIGLAGPIGITGPTGLTGSAGAIGPMGSTGPTGQKGDRYNTTTIIAYQIDISQPIELMVSSGLAYITGNSVLVIGQSNRMYSFEGYVNIYDNNTGYLNINNIQNIKPSGSTSFPSQYYNINLDGIDGPTGPTGYGLTGPTGYGSTGPTGYGSTGPTGYGSTGPTGYGSTGPTGYGFTGPTGYGSTGPTGYGSTGPTGYGSTGPTGAGISLGYGNTGQALISTSSSGPYSWEGPYTHLYYSNGPTGKNIAWFSSLTKVSSYYFTIPSSWDAISLHCSFNIFGTNTAIQQSSFYFLTDANWKLLTFGPGNTRFMPTSLALTNNNQVSCMVNDIIIRQSPTSTLSISLMCDKAPFAETVTPMTWTVSLCQAIFATQPPPIVPQEPSITASYNYKTQQMMINAYVNDNGGSPVTSYSYSLDNGSTYTTTANAANPIVISIPISAATYNIKVKANNAIGNGTLVSNTATVTVINVTPPAEPYITSIDRYFPEGPSNIVDVRVGWETSSTGGLPITYFNLYVSDDGPYGAMRQVDGSQATVTGNIPNPITVSGITTFYPEYYYIIIGNDVGNSVASSGYFR